MGAEVYLQSQMDQARQRYGSLFEIINQMHDLAHLDVLPQLRERAEALFESLTAWYAHTSSQDMELFDYASQIRDLANGDQVVWLQALTVELVEAIRHTVLEQPSHMSALLDAVMPIYHLAHRRTEEAIPALIEHMYQEIHLLEEAVPDPETKESCEQAEAQERDERVRLRWILKDASIKDALLRVEEVRRGDVAASLRLIFDEIVLTIHEQETQVHQLDAEIVDEAFALHNQLALDDTLALLSVLQSWQRYWQQAYRTLLQTLEQRSRTLMQHISQESPHPPLADTCTLARLVESWDLESVESAGPIVETCSVLQQRLAAFLSPFAQETAHSLWRGLGKKLIERFALAASNTEALIRRVRLYDDLVRGESREWLIGLANGILTALRPPLPPPLAQEVDPSVWKDDRPTLAVWKQVARMVSEKAKQIQEQGARSLSSPLFSLSVQLRDLLSGEPGSRLYALAFDLMKQLPSLLVGIDEGVCTMLQDSVMQIADLAEGSPLRRLRIVTGVLLERLKHEGYQRQTHDDVTHLLELASGLQELSHERVRTPLLLLSQRLQKLVEEWEQREGTVDTELLAPLHHLVRQIEQEEEHVGVETMHKILLLLKARLFPADSFFFDPYNTTNLLLILGFDWWRDVLPRVEPQSQLLPLNHVHWLYQLISQTLFPFPGEEAWQRLQQQGLRIEQEGEYSRAAWYQRFQHNKEQLQTVLKHAIDLEEPLFCSL